jgi:hypothetical protein
LSQTVIQEKRKQLTCPSLSLAVYREIVAHLRQIDGVSAGLLEQTAKEFDYLQSQVGGLWLEYLPRDDREEQIQSILAYYELKYDSSWKYLQS